MPKKLADNFLQHYGILGMKWGRRKARASSSGTSTSTSSDHEKKRALQRKSLKDMSNTELEYLTKRLNLEKNYRSLTVKQKSQGRKILEQTLQEVGKKAVSDVAKQILESDKVKQAIARVVGRVIR